MKIAFYKGRTKLFNRLVSWYLNSPYSHCEVVLDDSKNLCGSSSFRDNGVRIKVIEFDSEHWDIIDIEVSIQDQILITSWFNSNLGKPYDVLGLIGFLFRRQEGEKTKYFCSEAVAEALGYSESFRYDPAVLYSVLTRSKGQR